MIGGWTPGYTFHGDAIRVFREFFGGDNPFSGALEFSDKCLRLLVIKA